MTNAVVFDIGGVILDWNPRYLYRALFDGDEAAMERFLGEVCTPEWNLRQDAGRPFAEAVAALAAAHPSQADLIAAFDARWEDMVRGVFEDTAALVAALRARGTALYALTNFSMEKWRLVRPRYPVFELFDDIVVSGAIGVVKPNPRIYRHLLDRHGLAAERCLFVDDSAINVAGARAVGMDAVRFLSAEALRAELERRALI